MAVSEFELIERFFRRDKPYGALVNLGIGDDCALLTLPEQNELAVTVDTMVENTHFFPGVNPKWLGHKILAVNLSDLAAMGAKPFAVTLALTLPKADASWLQQFGRGFFELADRYAVDLIGGDTTSGNMALTVQAFGSVPIGKSLKRNGAQVGDAVMLAGKLGDAGLALQAIKDNSIELDSGEGKPLHCPQPQVAVGMQLRSMASACIDVSDGLLADLGHLLQQSQVGVTLDWGGFDLSAKLSRYIQDTGDWRFPLKSGEDYALCFTMPQIKIAEFMAISKKHQWCIQNIGIIESRRGIRMNKNGNVYELQEQGYDHFAK